MAQKRTKRKPKTRSITVTLLLLLLLALLFFLYRYYKDEALPEGTAAVYYIDVGQGDSALIVSPTGETMLIDAGEKNSGAAAFLKKKGIESLDYLVFSHFDSDHIGGGEEVLEAVEVKRVITPDCAPATKTGQSLLEAIGEEGAEHTNPTQGMMVELGEIRFQILSDETIIDEGKNDDSIVMLMTFGKNKFLFSGDAEKKRETQVVEDYGPLLDADVMKAGHHGASNANNENLLAAVTPEIVVISCGENNKYGHPTDEALKRFSQYASTILRTDWHGTVSLFSDGEELTYRTEKEASTATAALRAPHALLLDPQALFLTEKTDKAFAKRRVA